MPTFILIFASYCIYAKAETSLPSISKSLNTKEIGKILPRSKKNILTNNEQGNDSINDAADVSSNKKYEKDNNDSDSSSNILSNINQESDISPSNNEKNDDSSLNTENSNINQEDNSFLPDPIIPSFEDFFPNLQPFQPNFKKLPHVEMRILDGANNNCLELLEILKICKEDPHNMDCWRVNNIDDLICIINDSSNINDELAKIESNYDLHIQTNKNISLIDLSQIKRPMTIYLTKEWGQNDDIIVGLAGVNESQIKNLIIESIFIQIKDSPLKMNNTVLRYSQMVLDSEPIISKNIDLDVFSINNINLEKLQHEHISVTISYFNNRYFRVFINESEWDILYREYRTDVFSPLFVLPYNFSETLNLNVEAVFIDLYVANENIKTVKDINMAIFSPHYNAGNTEWTPNVYDKNKIILTTSGNWKGITEATVNITYYDEYTEIEKYLSSKVNLIDSPIYTPEKSEISSSSDDEESKDDPNAYPEYFPFQPESYPKRKPFTNLYITGSMSLCKQYQSFIQKCNENPKDEECIDFDEDEMPKEVICCSNINNINNELANINNNNDLLISTEKSIPDIDLNQLKSKKSVTFESMEPPDFDFDFDFKRQIKRKNRLLKIKPKDEIIDYPDIEIGIRGNINEKVSSLIFKSESDEYSKTPKLMLKVIEAPLTIDYLELRGSKISFESEIIKPNRMMFDTDTYDLHPSDIFHYIQVKQFSFYIPYQPSYKKLYRISFLDNKWDISTAFFNDPNQTYFSIFSFPYNKCGRFNLITVGHFFDLHVEKGNSNVRPVNITVLSFEKQNNEYPHLLDDSKFLVRLTSSGHWDDINSNVSVYFSGFQEYLNLENECNSKITVSKFSLHEDGTITPPAPDEDEIPIVSTVYQPPFSTFTFSSQLIVTNDNSMCSSMKKFYEKCKKNPNEEYCESFESIEYYGCTTPQNINNELQNLPPNSYALAILTLVDIPDIDFNNLKHKISIFLSYEDDTSDLKMLSKKEGKKIAKNTISRKKISTANVGIKGNIKEKVSFLRLQKITVKILDSPLNIENLLLQISYIDSNSQQIQCQNLIVDGVTHGNFISSSMSDKIKVTQYGIKDYQYDADDYQYRISFGKDRWSISKSGLYGEYYYNYFPKLEDYSDIDESMVDEVFREDFPIDVPDYIPYSFCERFAFIIPSYYFTLYLENDTSIAKPINITLMNLDSLLLDKSKYPVKIISSGNWEKINDPVSIYFTYFKNFVDLDTSKCNSKINVTRHEAFNPIIIIDSTSKDEKEAGKVDLIGIDSDKIKDELDKHFDKNNDGDQYISISDDKETSFTNLNLAPNQYIKLQENARVTLSGGNLNLLLNDESSTVSINVTDNSDVKLSIKNKAESTVNIETKKDEVSINSNSEVYSPLKLTVSESVKEIKIDSINLHDAGSISATRNNDPNVVIPITVNNLQAQAQTSGKLTKVTISNEFSISETASLELDNVELEGTKLNLNLHSYNYANYISPMLHGTLGKPPSSIELKKPTNGKTQPSSQEKDKQFLIFQGKFTSSCESWKMALNFSDTFFNNAECQSYPLTLEESRSLLINRVSEGTKNPNDDKDKNNKGKKLTSGEIAGIVIGVVGGVAIIVIIITVIIIKKKKKDNSADESDKVQVEP